MEHTNEDKGQCVLFPLLSVTKPLLYGSQFDFVAVQLPLKSIRQQSTLQRHFAFHWVVESCLFIELNTNTHRCTYTHRGTVTHTQEYMQSLVETGRHPRCITLPVHFKDLSSSLDKSTSAGWLICTRLAVLADSGCHVDSISDVTQWSLKRAMIGMETSHTKGRQTKTERAQQWRGGGTNSVYSQLIKTSSEAKTWLQPCV